MKKIKNIRRKIITTVCMGLLVCSTVALAAPLGYVSYRLPVLQGNNYTNTHDKTTKTANVENKVTALSFANAANFWVEKPGGADLTTKYSQRVSSSYTTLAFYNGSLNSSAAVGSQVLMAMENVAASSTTGFVSGYVDFK